MNIRNLYLCTLCLICFPSASLAQNTVVFTTNTTIGVGDTTHDGKDIIVRGCALYLS